MGKKKIRWYLDRESGFISMHYAWIGEVFRTRRYGLDALAEELGESGFSLLRSWSDEYRDACIAVFEKTC